MIWNYCTGDYLIYNLAYLELQPEFECLNQETGAWQVCPKADYCAPNITSRINYENEESLRNWVQDLDLACKTVLCDSEIGDSHT